MSHSLAARLDAVQLWLGRHGYFCATTAAYLLGLDGIPRPDRITVARTSAPPTPPWLKVHRLAEDDRPKVRAVGGRRLPPVERILLDLVGVIPVSDVGRALDDALRRRLTTPASKLCLSAAAIGRAWPFSGHCCARWHFGHDAFKSDVRRHRAIASVGIELLFFTWDEVASAPTYVEAEVHKAVERRRPRLFSRRVPHGGTGLEGSIR